jgi:pyruvate dehydrogenase E2 component (dihydrolipoamide acetyltransferase)
VAQIIGLPKLSPTMEEGVLVRWTKKEGDKVSPGDLVAEVETDKANMDFNIEDDGVLLKLLVKEGDTVKLGAPVAIIGKAGEDVSALVEEARASGGGAAPAKAAAPEARPAATKPVAAKPAAGKPAAPGGAKPGVPAGKSAAPGGAKPAAPGGAKPAAPGAKPVPAGAKPAARPAAPAGAKPAPTPAAAARPAPRAANDQIAGGDGAGVGPEDSANAPAAQRAPREATRPEQDQSGKAAVRPAAHAGAPGDAARSARPAGGRLLASPLAKTLAIELGIDLRQVTGSGPGGRIIERDVRAAAKGATGTTNGHPAAARGEPAEAAEAPDSDDAEAADAAPADAEAAAAVHEAPTRALAVRAPARARPAQDTEDDWEDIPASNMRKRIAARLTEAKRDVPHFYLMRDLDAAPLLAYRQRLNDLLGDRGKVSVNDLIVKAVALALRRMPECNASWEGDAIRHFHRVHIGVAVAIPDGLITPVVRDADMKGIGAIAAEIKDLADRAKNRALKVHEITGSTFSVSNLGMFGIERFTAILNPPEAGILAIGAVRDAPVVDPRDPSRLVPGKRMTVTMSCDHRVIDGALGARWLQVFGELIEKPESLAL